MALYSTRPLTSLISRHIKTWIGSCGSGGAEASCNMLIWSRFFFIDNIFVIFPQNCFDLRRKAANLQRMIQWQAKITSLVPFQMLRNLTFYKHKSTHTNAHVSQQDCSNCHGIVTLDLSEITLYSADDPSKIVKWCLNAMATKLLCLTVYVDANQGSLECLGG